MITVALLLPQSACLKRPDEFYRHMCWRVNFSPGRLISCEGLAKRGPALPTLDLWRKRF
jgi:hypothetical protein